jgi:cadmium resistance protein CadD (predicted permease)
LRALNQFVVKVANLLEAEGRVVRYHVTQIVQGGVMIIAAGTLVVVGLVTIAAAAFLGLRLVMPAWVALGLVGLVPLVLGVIGAMVGKDMLGR